MSHDLALINGCIYTLDPAHPSAEALLIEGGRIRLAGATRDVLDAARPGTPRLDLGGRCALPGFHDAHLHLVWHGMALQQVDLLGADSLDEALRRIAERTGGLAPGQWLLGRGWDHNLWPGATRPTRHDLDRLLPHNPARLGSKDGHSIWLNSHALELAHITRDTPAPAGGQILRDAHGEPMGILTENATDLLDGVVPEPDDETMLRAARLALEDAARHGLTALHTCDGPASFRALARLDEAGELAQRVWHMVPLAHLGAAIELGWRTGFGSARLRVGHVKMFADGALGSGTAEMLAPYEGRPGDYGVAATPTEVLGDAVRRAAQAGLASAIHAIGDGANRRVLEIYARVRAEGVGVGLRHRIEHAQLVDPTDQPRLAQLGIIASMQPIHATQDQEMADRQWGERARYGYAWRSLVASGAHLALGTDCPVESLDPLANLYAAVARRRPGGDAWHPQECLTLDQALRAYTLGSAYAAYQEGALGSLTVGKWGDLVVLSQDITRLSPEALLETHIESTVVGGQVIYDG